MAKIILRRIELENVGQHRGPLILEQLDDRINLITGRNEIGKSTIVNALRCLMFERHNAKHAKMKELQPYNDTTAAPIVKVELQLDGELVRVTKQFLVRPNVELQIGPGSFLTGRDADLKLVELLGASEPSSRGMDAQGMGMWGLLWLNQDDTARVEPAKNMAEKTRGQLTEIIQRQVGRVTGGVEAERLHGKLQELWARHWTPERAEPTGDFGRLLARAQELELEVRGIEAMAGELASLGQSVDTARREHEQARQLEQKRQLELEEARRLSDTLGRLQQSFERATLLHQNARARLEQARSAATERREFIETLETETRSLERHRAELREAEPTIVEAEEAAAHAREQLAQLEATHARARAELERARATHDAAVRRNQLFDQLKRYEEIERVRSELQDVDQHLEQDGLTDEQHQSIERLQTRLSEAERKSRVAAARLLLRSEAHPPDEQIIVAETSIETPQGKLIVHPGRPGLAGASARARVSEARLEEALRSVDASDLAHARRRRAERIEAEEKLAQAEEKLSNAAPKGLEALVSEAELARAKEDRAVQELAAAVEAELQVHKLREERQHNPISEQEVAELRKVEQRLRLAESRCTALGTHIILSAEKPVELCDLDGNAKTLHTGEKHEVTVTRACVIGVKGILELSIEPLGGDLAQAEREVATQKERFESMLGQLGVSSVELAEVSAARRTKLDAELERVEAVLETHAPKGVAALRGFAADQTNRRQEVERALSLARSASATVDEVGRIFQGNRVTDDMLASLEELSAEAEVDRGSVEGLSARLILPEGSDFSTRVVKETSSGSIGTLEWELVPGEVSLDLVREVEAARLALANELDAHGVDSVETATQMWETGIRLHARHETLKRQLEGLAPGEEDTAALTQHARMALSQLGGMGESVENTNDAQERAGLQEQSAARACAEVRVLVQETQQSSEAKRRQRAATEAVVEKLAERTSGLSRKLEALRVERSDEVLNHEESTALEEFDKSGTALAAAQAELEQAQPELRVRGVELAEAALEASRERATAASGRVVAAETKLDHARVEGRFEVLGEKRSELSEARSRLTRLQSEAEAIKLLMRVVDEERKKAEQRLLGPLVEAIQPYLQLLRPGTQLRLSPELEVEAVVRNGVTERLDQLSGGTREQLAVLVRLGLARVLAKGGHVFPLILDDTLGWTDDHRFGEMMKILNAAADEMQIIVLSCHPSRFDGLGAGRTFDLDREPS